MPLLKCSASKAKPKNGISYITNPKKVAEISSRTRTMRSNLSRQQSGLVREISLTKGSTIISNCRVQGAITLPHSKPTFTPKRLQKSCLTIANASSQRIRIRRRCTVISS